MRRTFELPMGRLLWLLLLVAFLHPCVESRSQGVGLQQTDVFVSGEGGYHTYRIPSMVATKQGKLLAICEGRRSSSSDTGDVDLLLRTSGDGGKTWSATKTLWDDAKNTCGNPCAVVDRTTGTVWLLATWNRGDDHERQIISGESKDTRRVFVTSSIDEGETWAEPKEITTTIKLPNWTWYATGPGCGIQIEQGAHAGRLVIPCDHIEADTKRYYSHVIYSDDHGKSWQLGGRSPNHQVNECEVVELTGGRLMLNMRNYEKSVKSRQVCVSDDGGITWRDQRHEKALIEPICQASIRRYAWPAGGQPGVLFFSNPASELKREKLTLRASLDDGVTWPVEKQLYAGVSAYSCLVTAPDESIGCLYEADGYRRIVYARLHVPSLLKENSVRNYTP